MNLGVNADANGAASEDAFMWFYSSQSAGKWWQYDTIRQRLLESAFAQDPESTFDADIGPHTFVFDLKRMTQTRKGTRYVRQMKRCSTAADANDMQTTGACRGVSGLLFGKGQ